MTNLDEATDVRNAEIPVRIAADDDVSESGVVASVGVAGVDRGDDGTDSSVLWHGWSKGAGNDGGVVVDVVDEDGDGGGARFLACVRATFCACISMCGTSLYRPKERSGLSFAFEFDPWTSFYNVFYIFI